MSDKSFSVLAGVPVWYHLRDEPNRGDEEIFKDQREYNCSPRLLRTLTSCFDELFQIWPFEKPNGILTMGTIGDGEQEHGRGNAFDLSGLELADGKIFRVFDYQGDRLLHDALNAHLFLYFPQVLNHFYPNHRDHFHVDFNFESQNHFRTGSKAQLLFLQSVLRNGFDKDLGTSGRYGDGIDGTYGSKTRRALDEVLYDIGLAGNGGLSDSNVWSDFVIHARRVCFERIQRKLGGQAKAGARAAVPAAPRRFVALTEEVYNRGRPPVNFLNELIDWALQADEEIFARNEGYDIYSRVSAELGPWQTLSQRKAVMCEVLRVLAGFESSWDWMEGRDMSANNIEHDTIECGIFQCSSNSIAFFKDDPYLETLLGKLGVRERGPQRSKKFETMTKQDHQFAFEYCSRLLRQTINHHGPIKHYYGRTYQGRRHDGIGTHVRREAVSEFLSFL